jgi:hypothetical protein
MSEPKSSWAELKESLEASEVRFTQDLFQILIQILYSGAWEKMIHDKNLKQKIS